MISSLAKHIVSGRRGKAASFSTLAGGFAVCETRLSIDLNLSLLRRQIRLRDHWTIDDRLGRPQTSRFGAAN
jgi:hypothetical protein